MKCHKKLKVSKVKKTNVTKLKHASESYTFLSSISHLNFDDETYVKSNFSKLYRSHYYAKADEEVLPDFVTTIGVET